MSLRPMVMMSKTKALKKVIWERGRKTLTVSSVSHSHLVHPLLSPKQNPQVRLAEETELRKKGSNQKRIEEASSPSPIVPRTTHARERNRDDLKGGQRMKGCGQGNHKPTHTSDSLTPSLLSVAQTRHTPARGALPADWRQEERHWCPEGRRWTSGKRACLPQSWRGCSACVRLSPGRLAREDSVFSKGRREEKGRNTTKTGFSPRE